MAAVTPSSIQRALLAWLEAYLDSNSHFVIADIGAASSINYIEGLRKPVVKTPAVMVDCGDWDVAGQPVAMVARESSQDTGRAQIIGLVQYVDDDVQDEKIKEFAWAVKEVLELSPFITDTESGREFYGSVRSVRIRFISANPYVEGEADPEFRAFQIIYAFSIPRNV